MKNDDKLKKKIILFKIIEPIQNMYFSVDKQKIKICIKIIVKLIVYVNIYYFYYQNSLTYLFNN